MVISIQFSFKMVISVQIQPQNDFDPIQPQNDFNSVDNFILYSFCRHISPLTLSPLHHPPSPSTHSSIPPHPLTPSSILPHPLTPSSILPHRLVKMKAVETENKNLKKDINKMKEDFECTRALLDAQVCGWGCMVYGYGRMLPY